MGRWENKDNWEGDRDVDEYAGQDWKSRILGGNYDNRYRGVKNYGWGSRRNRNKKKSATVVIVICIIIVGSGFILFSQGYLDELIQNMPQQIQDVSKTAKEFTSKTIENVQEITKDVSDNLINSDIPESKSDVAESRYKDCSIYDFEKLPMSELLKLPDEEQYEYHKKEVEMLTSKIDCNQYNRDLAQGERIKND